MNSANLKPEDFLVIVSVLVEWEGLLFHCHAEIDGTFRCGKCGRGVLVPNVTLQCAVCHSPVHIRKEVNWECLRRAEISIFEAERRRYWSQP